MIKRNGLASATMTLITTGLVLAGYVLNGVLSNPNLRPRPLTDQELTMLEKQCYDVQGYLKPLKICKAHKRELLKLRAEPK